MDDENKYERYAHIPIPTYHEAISSRPSSSQNFRGPGEISDDAERQGLLPQLPSPGTTSYQPPNVDSPRSSEDSNGDLRLPEVGADGSDERRRIEELDYLDPHAPDPAERQSNSHHRARIRRTKFSRHLSNLGATLSSLRLPSFRRLYTPVSVSSNPTPDDRPTRRFAWPSGPLPRIPDQYRISAGTAARLCGLLSIAIGIYALFLFDIFPSRGYMGSNFNPEAVRQFIQEGVQAKSIEDYLAHITSYDHVAGTEGDLFMAEWQLERWTEEGGLDDAALLSYYVYLNYPRASGRAVEILSPESKKWRATLEEDVVDSSKQQTQSWHGMSKTGDAEGHLVYANGGSKADFAWLKERAVNVSGSIALIRTYNTQDDASLKVKAAEEAGCAGVLLYSDPSDDGSAKGGVWPEGPFRPDDSVQRASVAFSTWVMGDPLTPGYSSTKDAERLQRNASAGLSQIPSLPLAWRDARELLQSLQGVGAEVPGDWVGGSADFPKQWFSGTSGKDSPIVSLKNDNDENVKQQIWNLHGLIEGLEQREKKIYVGSPRDAWCFGSIDPGSGSAVLMEMVRIFGQLRKLQWRPLRSIEFVSWDAKEFNMMGSTEYVEDNADYLRDAAIAYLNVDMGVYGPNPVFKATGSPMLQAALHHVLDRVSTPGDEMTLRQAWAERQSRIEEPDTDGDYAAFQYIAGTSSMDFGLHGPEHGFPSHSCYETLEWMQKFGDPEFSWHQKLAQVWALLILELADRPILPFDLGAYASEIQTRYIPALQSYAESENRNSGGKPDLLKELGFDLQPLREVADSLVQTVLEFQKFEDHWTVNVLGAGGMENANFAKRRVQYNNKLANFERDLLDLPTGPNDNQTHGIPGREQFKHVLFGPSAWGGRKHVAYFPAVVDAIDKGDWNVAQQAVQKAARILKQAEENLTA